MKNSLLLPIFLLFCLLSLHAQDCNTQRYRHAIFDSVLVRRDIVFGRADPFGSSTPSDLHLDFYEPYGDSQALRPLLIYVHGGGFTSGDKTTDKGPEICTYFAKHGYSAASIDYRLGFNPLFTYSAERAVYRAIQDLRAATRYLLARSASFKTDSNFVIWMGASAGSITVLHSAFMNGSEIPTSYRGTGLESSNLGGIDSSGNNDYGNREVLPIAIVNLWGAIIDTGFINANLRERIPVLSLHGDNDIVVPYYSGHPYGTPTLPNMQGSFLIHEHLKHIDTPDEFVTLYGASHSPFNTDTRWLDTIFKHAEPFLFQVLQPAKPVVSPHPAFCYGRASSVAVSSPSSRLNYCWENNDTLLSVTDSNSTLHFQRAERANTWAWVRAHNEIGAASDADSTLLQFIDPPLAACTQYPSGRNIHFNNSSLYASSYTWFFGDGSRNSSPSPTHLYADSGTYTALLVAMNEACTDTLQFNVEAYDCPIGFFNYSLTGRTLLTFNGSSYFKNNHWYWGDGDSSSDVNGNHVYQQPGLYTLTLITDNGHGCYDTMTRSVQVDQVASVSENRELTFQVYPNPVHDELYIRMSDSIDQNELKIFDIQGRLLLSKTLIENLNIFDMKGFEPGMYFLLIQGEGKELIRYRFFRQ